MNESDDTTIHSDGKVDVLQKYYVILAFSTLLLLLLYTYFFRDFQSTGASWRNQLVQISANFWIDQFVKVIGALVLIGIALWRWSATLKTNDRKAHEDAYLKAVETIRQCKTQSGFTGASYQLLHLAKADSKYILPGTLVLESAIRELSEDVYRNWINDMPTSSELKPSIFKDKDFSPSIKDMLVVALKIRELARSPNSDRLNLPKMNLRRADLRGLSDKDFTGITGYEEDLIEADLQQADLRAVNLTLGSKLLPSHSLKLNGALVSMTRIDHNNFHGNATIIARTKDKIQAEPPTFPCIKDIEILMSYGARLFLLGSWASIPNNRNIFSFNREEENEEGGEKKGCRFSGGPEVDLSEMIFDRCDFSYAHLYKASFVRAEFNRSIFNNTDLRRVDFSGATIHDSWFKGANLEGAVFSDKTKISHSEDKSYSSMGLDKIVAFIDYYDERKLEGRGGWVFRFSSDKWEEKFGGENKYILK